MLPAFHMSSSNSPQKASSGLGCLCFSKAVQGVGGTQMEQSGSFPQLADPCTPTREPGSLQ